MRLCSMITAAVLAGDPCHPNAGDCCAPGGNGTPGCEDIDCCEIVCDLDPWCCMKWWDGICADLAFDLCGCVPGEPCLPCADDEGEPCGTDTNGGCFSDPPVFGSLHCGETRCGSSWAIDGDRDRDWYLLTVTERTTISVALTSPFPSRCAVLDMIADCRIDVIERGFSNECITGTATATVAPGLYAIQVLPDTPVGIPCGSGNHYEITLSCETVEGCGDGPCCCANGTPGCEDDACCTIVCGADAFCCDVEWDQICADAALNDCGCDCLPVACCMPDGTCVDSDEYNCPRLGGRSVDAPCDLVDCVCPEDVDDDGAVGTTDLVAVVLAWGPCGLCPEDIDFDGSVGIADLVGVILAWGPCPRSRP